MLGGKGRVWFDLIAAVTVSLGVVCLEYLGGSSIPRPLCQSSREPTCREQHVVSKRTTWEILPCTSPNRRKFFSLNTSFGLTPMYLVLSVWDISGFPRMGGGPTYNSESLFVASLFTPLGLPQIVILILKSLFVHQKDMEPLDAHQIKQ